MFHVSPEFEPRRQRSLQCGAAGGASTSSVSEMSSRSLRHFAGGLGRRSRAPGEGHKEWQERSRQRQPDSCNGKVMLRTPAHLGDGSTTGRLRHGLNPARGPRAVAAMARDACFSRRQFHRLTLQVIGETPAAHQRRLRLDRGAWLLLSSRGTILDIALETGWESHEAFARAFRARFRLAPSAFRKGGGATLPRSMRLGFSISAHAAIRSTGSGQAPHCGYRYAKENI
jgi:AraC-like DNA-binding protein